MAIVSINWESIVSFFMRIYLHSRNKKKFTIALLNQKFSLNYDTFNTLSFIWK